MVKAMRVAGREGVEEERKRVGEVGRSDGGRREEGGRRESRGGEGAGSGAASGGG